jgi:hypothetical protein
LHIAKRSRPLKAMARSRWGNGRFPWLAKIKPCSNGFGS